MSDANYLSSEREQTATGGVAALDRAIRILNVFSSSDRSLSLAEIAVRTGLYKSTILRLANSLLHSQFMERLDDGRYRLGPGVFRLGALYQRSLGTADVILPLMRPLAQESSESMAFYVRSGGMRTCLCRIESPHALRYSIRDGDVLPLETGAGGRVLLAFSGSPGEPYETIRCSMFFISRGDRSADIVGVAAPVFGPDATLLGSLTLAGPSSRLEDAKVMRLVAPLLTVAARITRDFGGDSTTLEQAALSIGSMSASRAAVTP